MMMMMFSCDFTFDFFNSMTFNFTQTATPT